MPDPDRPTGGASGGGSAAAVAAPNTAKEATMPRLTDTHLVILSAAARRDDGAILPLPDSLSLNKGAAVSMLKGLIRKGLIEERPAAAGDAVWREGACGERIGLAITDAGLAAIGVEPDEKSGGREAGPQTKPETSGKPPARPPSATKLRRGTKQALLIDLLKRKTGATIGELVEATGWQAHSVRGAISGTLRKKFGLDVTSEKVEGRGRVYRIAGAG